VRVDRRDWALWTDEIYPVYLIAFDALHELAYWRRIELADIQEGPFTVVKTMHLSLQHRLTVKALLGFARTKRRTLTDLKAQRR
jgi:hypothetical protein